MTVDVKTAWNACGAAFDRFTTDENSLSVNLERPAIEKLAGDVAGARVLDLGCGSAAHSLWLAGRGADVLGLDLSAAMISLAHDKALQRGASLDLCVGDMNRALPFRDGIFDLVFTSTALHYVENISAALLEAARVMKPDGALIASVLHPMSTARFPISGAETDPRSIRWQSRSEWQARYFDAPTRTIETPWVSFGDVGSEGRQISCSHHTLSDYFQAVKGAGLVVTDLVEPEPPAEFAEKNPSSYDEAIHLPPYLILRARFAKYFQG